MVRAGATNLEIMAELGYSRAGLSAAVVRLGLAGIRRQKRFDKAAKRRERILTLRRQGATYEQIAEQTNTDFQHVAEICQKAGLGYRPAEHGDTGKWRAGCRCDKCVERMRADKKAQLERAKARGPLSHGHHGYTLGCRCDTCLDAYDSQLKFVEQAESLPTADRSGQKWTDEDLTEVATSPDRSVLIAKRLGRTTFAVDTVRTQINTGVRYQEQGRWYTAPKARQRRRYGHDTAH